jgi:hypothetical protein
LLRNEPLALRPMISLMLLLQQLMLTIDSQEA